MDIDFSPNSNDKDENAAQSPLWDVIDFTGSAGRVPDHELTKGVPTVRLASGSSEKFDREMDKRVARRVHPSHHPGNRV